MKRELTVSHDYETSLTGSDKLELRLWLRLLTCSNLIEREVRKRLREEFDTTLPRFDMMAQLDRAPQGLTMGQLSAQLMVSGGNVTGLVDRLVGEGLAARKIAPDDRRSQLVRLTRRGKKAFDRMTPAHEAWVEKLLGELRRQDMTALHDQLEKMKTSLSRVIDRNKEPGQ